VARKLEERHLTLNPGLERPGGAGSVQSGFQVLLGPRELVESEEAQDIDAPAQEAAPEIQPPRVPDPKEITDRPRGRAVVTLKEVAESDIHRRLAVPGLPGKRPKVQAVDGGPVPPGIGHHRADAQVLEDEDVRPEQPDRGEQHAQVVLRPVESVVDDEIALGPPGPRFQRLPEALVGQALRPVQGVAIAPATELDEAARVLGQPRRPGQVEGVLDSDDTHRPATRRVAQPVEQIAEHLPNSFGDEPGLPVEVARQAIDTGRLPRVERPVLPAALAVAAPEVLPEIEVQPSHAGMGVQESGKAPGDGLTDFGA